MEGEERLETGVILVSLTVFSRARWKFEINRGQGKATLSAYKVRGRIALGATARNSESHHETPRIRHRGSARRPHSEKE